MNDNRTPAPRGIRTARRLVLLASTAGLGIAVLLGGPGGIPNFSALSSTPALAQTQQRPAGFADVVEEENGLFVPVEYKHGKEGKWLNDHIQLCAQALCLEERLPGRAPIPYGYIFYYGSRKRIQVYFTPDLRAKTRATIDLAFQVALHNTPPPPLDGKQAARCRDCSLISLCLPDEVKLLAASKGGSLANALPD